MTSIVEVALRVRLEEAERERDEALVKLKESRRDFVRVADALGLVSTDDTGRIGQVASVEEVVEQARKAQKCFELWEDAHAASLFMRIEKQRDEALKQARYAWERHAEKDRAYGDALRERDEAQAALGAAHAEIAKLAAFIISYVECALRERDEAQAALGAAWTTGGVSLAEGIRRKTVALEKLR